MPDPTLTPELALRYLDELSTDIRAAVLLDGEGRVAAARVADHEPPGESPEGEQPESEPPDEQPEGEPPTDQRAGEPPTPRLGELAVKLFEEADRAASKLAGGFEPPVSQVEAIVADAGVFAVRAEGWTIAVVAGRFALPSLMFYDLRAVLSDLGRQAA